MSKKVFACLLIISIFSVFAIHSAHGQATSFSVEGKIYDAEGNLVGTGYTVKGTNDRVATWSIYADGNSRADGTYTPISFIDFSPLKTTNVGDQITLEVVEDLTGKVKGRKTYTVTQSDVDNFRAIVDLRLSGITTIFDPKNEILADGSSTVTINVTVQNELGELVKDDTVSITSSKEGAISDVTNNGDGTYTATYTAPSLVISGSENDDLQISSTSLNQSVTETLALLEVPTIVTLTIDKNDFKADSPETVAIRVEVKRGVAIPGETIEIGLSGNPTDLGVVSAVTESTEETGVYTATYTSGSTVGKIAITATATTAGVSSDPLSVTINAGDPAKLELAISSAKLSSSAPATITATLTDVAGNGVGGKADQFAIAVGNGSVGDVAEKADAFGVYEFTYTAPVVEAEGSDEVTVSITDTEISAKQMIELTPIPPKPITSLVISGTTFKKGGTIAVSGVKVKVEVADQIAEEIAEDNGLYTATFFGFLAPAAQTGDLVKITVLDDQGTVRGSVDPFPLTDDHLDADNPQIANVSIDVTTDIGSTTNLLDIAGTVYLEDGTTTVNAGVSVKIENEKRASIDTVSTDDDGGFSTKFSADSADAVIAETDDVLKITVSNGTQTFETTHVLTTDEVEAKKVTLDLKTDLIATINDTLVIHGTIFLINGESPARDGLKVVVLINGEQRETTTEQGGTYEATYFVLDNSQIAATGDVVAVEVTAIDLAENEVVGSETHTLTTAEIKDRKAKVDVTTNLKASTRVLAVSGQIMLEDGKTPASAGLSIVIENTTLGLSQTSTTEANGQYNVTFFEPLSIVAQSDDNFKVIATNIDGSTTFETSHTVTTSEVEDQKVVDLDITTDFTAQTKSINVAGTVYLDGMEVPAKADLKVTVSVAGTDLTATATTDDQGQYAVSFGDGSEVVAETGSELSAVVERASETIDLKVGSDTITTAEVVSGTATFDIETTLGAETTLIAITGNVYDRDGNLIDSGLSGSASIGDLEVPLTFETDGSFQGTFISFDNSVIAETGSELIVTAQRDTGEIVKGPFSLTTKQILDQRAENLKVQFPKEATRITVSAPATVAGDGETTATITVSAFDISDSPVSGEDVVIAIEPEIGSISAITDQLDGTYTATYTAGTKLVPIKVTAQALLGNVSAETSFELVVGDPGAIQLSETPSTLNLDDTGKATHEITATITDKADHLVTDAPVEVSVDGVGSVSAVANNGDGTYVFTYTANKIFGDATVTITTATENAPIQMISVSVVDPIPPIVYAVANPAAVVLDQEITLSAEGTVDNVDLASYSWSIDGVAEMIDEISTTQVFDVEGNYTATVTVTDTAGNETTETIEFTVGGLMISATVREADGQLLQTDDAVIVEVAHLASAALIKTTARRSKFVAAFDLDLTAGIAAGDQLEVTLLHRDTLQLLATPTIHTVSEAEYEAASVQIEDLTTDRTSTYIVSGTVYDSYGQAVPDVIATIDTPFGRLADTTGANGKYSFTFRDYLTNPAVGEEIMIDFEVPGQTPRRMIVRAFETPVRVATADSSPLRLGGLSINTAQHRDVIDRLVAQAISQTQVGKLLKGELLKLVRNDPALRSQMTGLIESMIPPGVFPSQVILSPELPLVFENPGNQDLENFGNAVYPYPLAGFLEGLESRSAGLPLAVVGDKLDLYLIVPNADTSKVEFDLDGLMIEAQPFDSQSSIPHTFQLEEELAVSLLPAWPGLKEGDQQVFQSVKLKYAIKDLPEITEEPEPVTIEGKINEVVENVGSLQGEADAVLQELTAIELPEELSKQLDDIKSSVTDLQDPEKLEELLSNPEKIADLKNSVQDFLFDVGDTVEDLPSELADKITTLDENLNQLDDVKDFANLIPPGTDLGALLGGGLSNRIVGAIAFNRQIPAPTPADYTNEADLSPRAIGDSVIWETSIDINPEKIYYYYYEVDFGRTVSISGLDQELEISGWAIPDPRNLQIEDRGLIDALLTPEFQDVVAPVLDPIVSSVMSGGGAGLSLTQEDQDALTAILTKNSNALIAEITMTMDPKIASIFTSPRIGEGQTAWYATIDLENVADGDHTLGAVAYNADGDLIDRADGKSFLLDRTAPSPDVAISADQNSAVYQREDGTYVATALPIEDDTDQTATLSVQALHDASDTADLVGYIYQQIDLSENADPIWLGLITPPGSDYAGFGSLVADIAGGFLTPDQLGILSSAPATLGPDHEITFIFQNAEGDAVISEGKNGVRVVGIDQVLNISSTKAPTNLIIVAPEADTAKIAKIVISGREGSDIVYTDTLDLEITSEIANRTDHPLTEVVVEYKFSGDDDWTILETYTAEELAGVSAGSELAPISWTIEDYDEILTNSNQLEIRAIATNALTISDLEPESITLQLSADEYPKDPEILSLTIKADNFNIDSGGVQGEIVLTATTYDRTDPAIKLIRFETKRQNDTDWQPIGEVADHAQIEGEATLTWTLTVDTTAVDDSITADSPAARDADLDENPYEIRAIAIDVDDTAHDADDLIQTATISVDNVDDVAPLTGTEIVEVADGFGEISAIDGIYNAGGLINNDQVPEPVITFTAVPFADGETYESVILLLSLGGASLDPIPLAYDEDAENYAVTIPLSGVENGVYTVQAVAVDSARNQEVADQEKSIDVNVDNFEIATDPAEIVVTIEGEDPMSVADLENQSPRGVPNSGELNFSITLPSAIDVDDFDVLIDGQSARENGWLTISAIEVAVDGVANRSVQLASGQKEFTVTIDLNALAEGTHELEGKISTQGGDISFSLPKVEIDRTAPIAITLSPIPYSEVSNLPTIYTSFSDGGSGIDSESVTFDLSRQGETPESISLENGKLRVTDSAIIYSQVIPLDGGLYTSTVTASDLAGNETTTAIVFTVSGTYQPDDKTAPVITSFSPQGTVGSADVHVSVSANDPESGIGSVTIKIDDGSAVEGSEHTFTLDEGTHTATAVITNGQGLESTATWTFTVALEPEPPKDTTPPVITELSPQGTIQGAKVTLSAVASDDQSGIKSVSITFGGSTVSGSQRTITINKSGTYTAAAEAINGVGLKTNVQWSFSVELDQNPPTISSVSPQGTIRAEKPQISASVSDDSSGINKIVIAVANDSGKNVSGSTKIDKKTGSIAFTPNSALENGGYTVTVTATDNAGNSSVAKWFFVVENDSNPPVISAISPNGVVHTDKPIITASATDDISGVDSIDLKVNNPSGGKVSGSAKASDGSVTFTPSGSLSDGVYTVIATAKDNAGNSGSASWSFTIELDTVPPVISNLSPTSESRSTDRMPVISASYSDATSEIDQSSVKLTLDGNPVTPSKLTKNQVIFTPKTDLTYGRHTIKIEVSDNATPKANTVSQEWTFVVESREGVELLQAVKNYPNPFVNSTTIAFRLTRHAEVTIQIFDASLRLVKTIDDVVEVGDNKIAWDGKTDNGDELARGVYFCQVIAESDTNPEYFILKLALTR